MSKHTHTRSNTINSTTITTTTENAETSSQVIWGHLIFQFLLIAKKRNALLVVTELLTNDDIMTDGMPSLFHILELPSFNSDALTQNQLEAIEDDEFDWSDLFIEYDGQRLTNDEILSLLSPEDWEKVMQRSIFLPGTKIETVIALNRAICEQAAKDKLDKLVEFDDTPNSEADAVESGLEDDEGISNLEDADEIAQELERVRTRAWKTFSNTARFEALKARGDSSAFKEVFDEAFVEAFEGGYKVAVKALSDEDDEPDDIEGDDDDDDDDNSENEETEMSESAVNEADTTDMGKFFALLDRGLKDNELMKSFVDSFSPLRAAWGDAQKARAKIAEIQNQAKESDHRGFKAKELQNLWSDVHLYEHTIHREIVDRVAFLKSFLKSGQSSRRRFAKHAIALLRHNDPMQG